MSYRTASAAEARWADWADWADCVGGVAGGVPPRDDLGEPPPRLSLCKCITPVIVRDSVADATDTTDGADGADGADGSAWAEIIGGGRGGEGGGVPPRFSAAVWGLAALGAAKVLVPWRRAELIAGRRAPAPLVPRRRNRPGVEPLDSPSPSSACELLCPPEAIFGVAVPMARLGMIPEAMLGSGERSTFAPTRTDASAIDDPAGAGDGLNPRTEASVTDVTDVTDGSGSVGGSSSRGMATGANGGVVLLLDSSPTPPVPTPPVPTTPVPRLGVPPPGPVPSAAGGPPAVAFGGDGTGRCSRGPDDPSSACAKPTAGVGPFESLLARLPNGIGGTRGGVGASKPGTAALTGGGRDDEASTAGGELRDVHIGEGTLFTRSDVRVSSSPPANDQVRAFAESAEAAARSSSSSSSSSSSEVAGAGSSLASVSVSKAPPSRTRTQMVRLASMTSMRALAPGRRRAAVPAMRRQGRWSEEGIATWHQGR